MRATASTSVLFSPRRLFIAVGLAALVILVPAAIASREFEPRVRQAIVSRLSTSLDSTVELGDTRRSFFPPRLRAGSLTVRHRGRVDVPSLLAIQSLAVHLNLLDLWGQAIDRVRSMAWSSTSRPARALYEHRA